MGKLHYAFQTEASLFLILDFVNGGELFFHLKQKGRFSENLARLYSAEIGSALHYLHGMDVVYRDLKPENLLINRDGHIIITDFGLSKEIDGDGKTHTFCGTPEYLAPEILKGEPHSFAVDWWSLGTILFELLTGLPPFYSNNLNLMYSKILASDISYPDYVSADAKSLLNALLVRDPEKRADGKALKAHPFYKSIDWDALDKKEIEPEWIPPVKDELDISQVDESQLAEVGAEENEEEAATPSAGDDFNNFTFMPQGKMQ